MPNGFLLHEAFGILAQIDAEDGPECPRRIGRIGNGAVPEDVPRRFLTPRYALLSVRDLP
jgi:hypothetical protein